MMTALLLIFDPSSTWEKLGALPQHRVWRVFFLYLLPVMLLTTAVEVFSLVKFGIRQGDVVTRVVMPSQELLIRYESVKTLLDLVIIFGGAWLMKKMGEGFHRRHSYGESFATLGYSLGPFLLGRLLNAIPAINPWIGYSAAILLAVSALYTGIPRVMKPDPSNALGLYLMTSLGLIVITGLAHFVAREVLEQNIFSHGFSV
jgi:Yip1 domain